MLVCYGHIMLKEHLGRGQCLFRGQAAVPEGSKQGSQGGAKPAVPLRQLQNMEGLVHRVLRDKSSSSARSADQVSTISYSSVATHLPIQSSPCFHYNEWLHDSMLAYSSCSAASKA